MAKKETKKAKPVKEKKEKKNFFKNLRAEMKKVIWPTPKQVFNNTVAVLFIVAVVGIIVFILDVAFNAANKAAVEGVKKLAPANEVVSEEVVEGETTPTEGEEVVEGETISTDEAVIEEVSSETTEEAETQE